MSDALGRCVIAGVEVDALRGEVRPPGAEPVALSPMECEMLLYLARHHERVVSKEELLREVWRYHGGVRSRAVDATLVRVRTKLEGLPIEIESLRGRGLQLHTASAPVFAREETEEVEAPIEAPLLGREAVFTSIDAALARGARPLVLLGPTGMGKTAVLSAWATRRGAQRIDLHGIHSAAALRRSVAAALAIDGQEVDPRIRERMRSGDWVLDHAEQLDAEAAALLGSWLETGEGAVLVGSQQRLEPVRAEVLVLSELERPAATALIHRARAASGLPQLSDGDQERLLDQLGGHPLGLLVVAPLWEWLGDVSEALEVPVDASTGLTLSAAIDRSLTRLSPQALQAAHALATFIQAPTTKALAAVLELPAGRVLPALAELRLAGLASAVDGRVVLLSAVRTVLRQAPAHRSAQEQLDARQIRWLLSLPPTHADLGPYRRELEWALHRCGPADTVPLLTRHLLMLYAYGPLEDLVPEARRWTASLPVEQFATGQELLGWALFSHGDRHDAEALLAGCVDAIDDAGLRARGAATLAMMHAWWGHEDALQRAEAAELLITDDLEPYLRLDALVFLGSAFVYLDPERGQAILERAVVEAGAAYPTRGLNAAVSKLRLRAASPLELDRARWLMGRAGLGRSKAQRAVLDADLALGLLGAGEADEAWDRLQELVEVNTATPTPLGSSLLMDAALRFALRPERVQALLDAVPLDHAADFRGLLRSIVAGEPLDLPEPMRPYFEAWRDGAELPEGTDSRTRWVASRLAMARALDS